MTPSIAASLLREAARGWTSAERDQFYVEVKGIFAAQRGLELEAQYKLGYADGHDDGYADAEGEAEARSFDAALEDSTDN